jgi:Protein of unknown function (DUF3485)
MFNTIAKVLAVLLLASILLQRLGYATAQDAEPFHEAVGQAILHVPHSFGTWTSSAVPVPAAARKLLRPSAEFAREYTDIAKGRSATLLIVHCPDTRDLAGHYPERCYPAIGWGKIGNSVDTTVTVAGTAIRLRRYEFVKHNLEMQTTQVVYGTFLIPGVGVVPTMEAVYERAADYQSRLYGATQMQVIFGDGFPQRDEERVVTELLEQVWPVISVVKNKSTGS